MTWADPHHHTAGFFVWPPHLLDPLEAGDSVWVNRARVEVALWELAVVADHLAVCGAINDSHNIIEPVLLRHCWLQSRR